MKHYYKVVTPDGFSTTKLLAPTQVPILKYEIGKVMVPPVGPIFAFANLNMARTWIDNMLLASRVQILKGTGLRSQIQTVAAAYSFQDWTIFWKLSPRQRAAKGFRLVPGTVFLRQFTPLEIVT